MTHTWKTAVIGSGNVAQTKHSEAYGELADRIAPVAVCDPSAESRNAFGDMYGIPNERRVATLEELEPFRDDIELAVIATPVKFHRPSVEFAASQGWHILCEKPLALSVDEAEAMVKAAEAAEVRFGIVHNIYYMNTTGCCRAAIERGDIGEVRLVRCETYRGPWDADHWRRSQELGGHGHFFDCLYHEIYLTRRAVGRPIESLYAQTAHNVYDPGKGEVEDTMLCVARFEGGAMASFQDAMCAPHGKSVFETHGARGSIVRNIPVPEDRRWLYRDGEAHEAPHDPRSTPHGCRSVFEDFLDALDRGEEPPYMVRAGGDGLDNLRVVLAAYRSAQEGKSVDVNI